MKISYYNGEFKSDDEISVDYNDRAFYFGDGVYEVVRVYDNAFFTLGEHMDRLVRSASEIEINGLDREKLIDISSTTGRRPATAAPTPAPTKAASDIGVSRTRSGPYFSSKP